MVKYRPFKRKKNKNEAVSEVLGTILLLVITALVFSVVYATIFSIDEDPEPPSVNLVGSIDDNVLVLEHLGGKPLLLSTRVILHNENGDSQTVNVTDYLDNDGKTNSYWDIGESIQIDLDNLTGFNKYSVVDLTVVDEKSNKAVLMGKIQEDKYADIEISIFAPQEPMPGPIYIYINATNLGPCDAEGVNVSVELPDGIDYISHSGPGTYNKITGIWDIGSINDGDTASLLMEVLVDKPPKVKYTKLCFIIDGSDAISDTNFFMIKQVLAGAVLSGDIPNKGYVDLIIIQYGCKLAESNRPFVQVELHERLNETNPGTIAGKIYSINKMGSELRPLAHAFNYAIREIDRPVTSTAAEYYPSYKIVNLIIGGNPNVLFPDPPTHVNASTFSFWANAKRQRDELIKTFLYDGEIDAEAIIDTKDILDVDFLKDYIVYPSPGELISTGQKPSKPGWVKEVEEATAFQEAIKSLFDMSFSGGTIVAKLESTTYRDPNPLNDIAEFTIIPQFP